MVIDIDQLDRQLVDALDADLRLIRRGGAPPTPAAATFKPQKASPKPTTAFGPRRPAKPARPQKAKAAKAAVAASLPPAAGAPATTPAATIVALLRRGELARADDHIAMYTARAMESRDRRQRHGAATWATMRALLDGDETKARASLVSARSLHTDSHGSGAMDWYWTQCFWIALEWGDMGEQLDILDHCRERAYRYDDIEWRAPLTLVLARLGRSDEASREFDLTFEKLRSAARLDLMCILAEAAAFLGDVGRSARIQRHIQGEPAELVVIGEGWVCTGALARYQAHAAAGAGAWARADRCFQTAVDIHRELRAQPLLARTLREWGCSLIGRDNAHALSCIRESEQLASDLRLSGLVTPTQALPAA